MPDTRVLPVPPEDDLAGVAPGHTPRTEANSRLTALSGLVLFVLLAALGVTILRVHRLVTAHVVIGFMLIGPLVVKLASTGWRFVRYYTGDAEYGEAGPPRPLLRVAAPLVIVTTMVVLGTGIGLLVVGPGSGSPLVFLHKASFVVWFGVMTVHVLAYLLPALRWSAADIGRRGPARVLAGRRRRQVVVAAGLVLGLALGVMSVGWAHPWATWAAHGGGD